MSCNCNTPKNKSLCQLLDLDVAYTGNAMEVNGVYIRSGDNLRIVLDAILKGDQDQPTEEITNFWFGMLAPTEDNPANLNDYYLQGDGKIWQYTQPVPTVPASWVDTGVTIGGEAPEWGEITGDINLQTDLLAFIQENALSPESIGTNLHLGEDGKLNAGMDLSDVIPGTTILGLSETGAGFPFSEVEAGLLMYSGTAALEVVSTFSISNKNGNEIANFSTGQVLINRDVLVPNDNIQSASIQTGNIITNNITDNDATISVLASANKTLIIGKGGSSAQMTVPVETNARRFIVSGSTASSQGYIEYNSGMPTGITSQNVLVTKAYVDALQTQIDALEARVTALETP